MTIVESDTLSARDAVLTAMAGETIVTTLARTAAAHPNAPAYSDRVLSDADREAGRTWRTLTWSEFRLSALVTAAGLVGLGVQTGDRVAIMASNRTEHMLADSAALHAGAIPVSVYATLSPSQVTWYAKAASPTVVILEGADQVARWAEALEDPEVRAFVKAVVVIDRDVADAPADAVAWEQLTTAGRRLLTENPGVIEERIAGVQSSHPVTILFTSGTTGDPKGVVLTHENVLYEVHSSLEAGGLTEAGITISYLPFAHIAERVLGIYTPTLQGGHVHLISDPSALVGALAEVRPTRFFGVPRVWEKIMAGVSALLAMEPDEAKRAAVAGAMAVGREYVAAYECGGEPSSELAAKYAAMNSLVLEPMRARLGLDRAEWTVSAAAPMPAEVANFFAGLGFRMLDVYGMSETTAAVTSGTNADFKLGTVGKALPGIEVRLADDGEILARGPVVTPGYWNNPTATAELIDADGWVHTGDIGEFDDHGYLKVIDRKKELIITSSGKNIAPSHIENYLKESPLIGHAMVVGDGHSHLVALLTLDAEMAPLIAMKLGLADSGIEALAQSPQVLAQVAQAVESANARLSRPEQVKAYTLLPVEWSAETAELTPTLKLKRRVVAEIHAAEIAELYGE